jgi:TolB protein
MSRFDLTVLSLLSLCALLLLGLWGQSRRFARDEGATYLLYKTVDEVGRAQLHALPFTDEEIGGDLPSRPLTPAEVSVWDFAPSPDGRLIAYGALGEMGFSDLRLIDLASGQDRPLLTCENASCSGPSWSSNGQYLAYTRRSVNAFASGLLSPPRIWILDVESGETAAIFSDSQRLGLEARWSADGEWLCFVAPEEQKLAVINLTAGSAGETGQTAFYPTATGETCAWDRSRRRLYTTDFRQSGDEWMTHLIAIDVESGEQVELSGAGSATLALVHDSSAVPSADGAWLAFRRKELEGPGATRGSQIWRMRPDGTEATALTADPAYDHGPPVWSPDGRFLITRRFPVRGPDVVPSLWLIDVETGALRLLVEPGDFPAIAR